MNFTVPKDIDMTQQASWCPGCGHGIVCRIITEAVQELGVSNKVLTVDDVACGQFGQFAMKYNTVMSAFIITFLLVIVSSFLHFADKL